MILNTITGVLVLIGLVFVSLGTVGLLRLPDVHSRLHALTKADNLGLGFIVLGLMLQADSIVGVFRLLLIWMLVLLAATTACYLVAREGVRELERGEGA